MPLVLPASTESPPAPPASTPAPGSRSANRCIVGCLRLASGSAVIALLPASPAGDPDPLARPGQPRVRPRAAVSARCRSRSQNRSVFLFLQKVGDVQKRVALQANVDKRRLHARKHARYFAFVNGTREGVFVFALVVNLGELDRFPRIASRVSCGVVEMQISFAMLPLSPRGNLPRGNGRGRSEQESPYRRGSGMTKTMAVSREDALRER